MLKKRIYFTTALILVSLLITSSFIYKEPAQMKLFLIEYTKGSSWNESLEFFDQKFASHHSKHLQNLISKKLVRFGARYSDKGIIFLNANDLNEAKELVNKDSSVINKMFSATVSELSVFYEFNCK